MKKILILAGILLVSAGCQKTAVENTKTEPVKQEVVKGGENNLPQGEKEGWQTFSNSQYNFEIKYPKNEVSLYTDYEKVKALSYIPVCNPEMLGCLYYDKNNLAKTNFGGAGVSVDVVKNLSTESKCLAPMVGEKKETNISINGVTFSVFSGNGAALSHYESYKNYRTFNSGVCINLSQRVTSVNLAVIETTGPDAIKEFNEKEVWSKLDQILSTFKFANTTSLEKTKVKVFLIAPEDNGNSGKLVGCGDSAVAIEREVEKTSAPLKASLENLLVMNAGYFGESGLFNSLGDSKLKLESVSLENTKAVIKLSGTLVTGGVCNDPRIEAQIRETAMQFSIVKSVEIYFNGKLLKNVLSGKGETLLVKVYFSNSKMQKDPNSCSELFAVDREIAMTSKVATSAITELLKGPLSAEKVAGYTTGLPVGSKLNSLKIVNGIAYADFNQATNSSGGSCNPLADQIKRTLTQFPTVKSVVLSVNGKTEGIFQP